MEFGCIVKYYEDIWTVITPPEPYIKPESVLSNEYGLSPIEIKHIAGQNKANIRLWVYPEDVQIVGKDIDIRELLLLLNKQDRLIDLSTGGMLHEEFVDREQVKLLAILDMEKPLREQREKVLKKILELIK